MRRKKKNKKLDIYTVLMLPLMTMFLLNIGLIATTWAWYTASITSGRNTITAGAQVDITVKIDGEPVEKTDGKYVLQETGTYEVTMKGGASATGYIVLMDIEDGDTTGSSATILDLFFTPINAESFTAKKYYADLSESNNEKTVSISVSSQNPKTLSISCLWNETGGSFISNITGQGYEQLTGSINLCSTSYTINLLDENGTPLKKSEVMAGISTFSENAGEDQDAVITEEDTEKTEITIPDIEGYELVSVNGEKPEKTYLLVEGQENVFNAKYRKIAESTEQNSEVTSDNNEEVTDENAKNQESNNVTVGGESVNEKVPEQTDPAVESTEPIAGGEQTKPTVDPVQIQETPVEQKTANTVQEQPATVPQEQQQDESSESETVDGNAVAQSEVIATDDSTEVVDDVTDEIGQ